MIMNTALPMMGGIRSPPALETVSTAPAKWGGYPVFFMSGMVICPVPATLAVPLPESIPNMELATTAIFAVPPLNRPQTP